MAGFLEHYAAMVATTNSIKNCQIHQKVEYFTSWEVVIVQTNQNVKHTLNKIQICSDPLTYHKNMCVFV